MNKKTLAIVIPCYNEAKRLPIENYKSFLKEFMTHQSSLLMMGQMIKLKT